jgi:hypothetical protein
MVSPQRQFRRNFGRQKMRPIYVIAAEIRRDWKKINYAAKPYLEAMACLNNINSTYVAEDAKSIILYFLSNASTWRGDTAKRIKAELKEMAK